MGVYESIWNAHCQHRGLLAVLLDPEKSPIQHLASLTAAADLLLIGGSTGKCSEQLIERLRTLTTKPLILFPGQVEQFSEQADALLFLSVLSSTNPEMLVGRQLRMARKVRNSAVESIPMGYILIDGGRESSVMRASQSQPIPQTDIMRIADTAIMAELLGKRLIYLEAGSGAVTSVAPDIVRAVREVTSVPLIVGGGIRTPEQMQDVLHAGADIVVIGNHFEQHPESVLQFQLHN